MSKYVFLCMPAHGHLNPTLAVAQELVARGEEVIYYLPESFRATIEATGATFRGYEMSGGNFAASWNKNISFLALFPAILSLSRRLMPQILTWLDDDRPDYIFYENMSIWARIAMSKLHIPGIRFSPTYVSFKQSSQGEMQGLQKIKAAMVEIAGDLRDLCNDYGIPVIEPQELFTHNDQLNIVFLPRLFQPDGEAFDERFVFVGPSISPRHDATNFPLHQLKLGKVLYISLGTVFNNQAEFFNRCFAAFKDQPWQVVLSRGTRLDESALDPIPENFLVAPFVPQLAVLERAQIFVTHGGMNSTMESLYYGVPMVAVPQMPEQAMTARRVQELGLGIALSPEQLSSELLRDSVIRVAQDPSYRERVQEMQKAVHEAGGYKQAADAIIRFSRTQHE